VGRDQTEAILAATVRLVDSVVITRPFL
jgi:hypothetical protein